MYVYAVDFGGTRPFLYSKRESAISDAKELFESHIKSWNINDGIEWETNYTEDFDYICFSGCCGSLKEVVNVFRIEVCED